MSTSTVPEHYPEIWDKSWVSALQTADSRLLESAESDSLTGDRKWYNIGGTIAFKQKAARYAATSYVDYTTSKSWIYPEAWDAPVLQDEWDEEYLDSIVVPSSRIMQDQAAAYNRLRDAYIRDAITGSRITGASGTTTETFPSANQIDANWSGTDEGITFAKVNEATRLMDNLRVPMAQRYFTITSKQKAELMEIAQATSRDYVNTMLIRAGQIHGTEWAGFTWLQYEDLELDATDTDARVCTAHYKPDIVLGETGMKTYMDVLPERSHALQIRPSVKLGSARINNSSIKILCKE